MNRLKLADVGSGALTDNYGDSYTTMDFKVSVPLNRYLRSFVELRNLNDEPRRRYSGSKRSMSVRISW